MTAPAKQLLMLAAVSTGLWMPRVALPQADPNLGANWHIQSGYNPASIARPGYLYLVSDISRQWLGIDGSPQVFRLQASQYIDRLNTALGFSMTGDAIGATRAYNPMINYAYRVPLQKKRFISMGLSAGLFARSINGTAFESDRDGDPAIDYGNRKLMRPDVNAGVEFQSQHLVISLASTHLLSMVKPDSLLLNNNHRYVSVVYRNEESDLASYYLGMQIVNRQTLFIAEWNACIRFKHPTGLLKGPADLFEVGLTLRSSRQMAFLFGLFITPDLRIGYLYNQSFITGYYPNGGHEVMVEYRVKLKSPDN
jgi:type IX secretion system PorP/SprF family membrane protein